MDPIEYIEKTLADLQNGLSCYSLGQDWLDEEGGWLTRNGDNDDKELDFYLNLPPEYDPPPCSTTKRPILGRKEGESSDEASSVSDLGSSSLSDPRSSSSTQDHSYSSPGPLMIRRPSREMSVSSGFSPPSSPGLNASQDGQSDCATTFQDSQSNCALSYPGLHTSLEGLSDCPTSSSSLHAPKDNQSDWNTAFQDGESERATSLMQDMDISSDVFATTLQDLASLQTSPGLCQSTGFFDFLETSASTNFSLSSLSCLDNNNTSMKPPSFAAMLSHRTQNELDGMDNGRNGSVSKLLSQQVCAISPSEGNMCPNMSLRRAGSMSSLPAPSLQLTSSSSIVMFHQEEQRSTLYCVFCKKNRETREFYSTHVLKDHRGRVICPILRKYVCPTCGATGERAHTVRHCPQRAEAGQVTGMM